MPLFCISNFYIIVDSRYIIWILLEVRIIRLNKIQCSHCLAGSRGNIQLYESFSVKVD